jgi:hypothetical protein
MMMKLNEKLNVVEFEMKIDQSDLRVKMMSQQAVRPKLMSGHSKTVFMAVLMLFVFVTGSLIIPKDSEAHFGQAKNDPCIDCHNGNGNNAYVSPWGFAVESTFTQDTDAVIYVAVDGVDESPGNGGGLDTTAMQVTVLPSATIELDVLWKNKGGGNASDLMIKFPDNTSWTGVGVGTAGSAPTNWNPDAGGAWQTTWDQGTLAGGTPGLNYYMNMVGDGNKGSVPNAEATKFWTLYMDTGSLATGASNQIIDAPSSANGVKKILSLLKPGDMALLLVLSERDKIFDMLTK